MKIMKKVTRYQCQFCKKDFKTPDKHQCKFNPELKNCFTCKNFKRWINDSSELHEIMGLFSPPCPDCTEDYADGWNIEAMKDCNYNMQCDKWQEGKYDWLEEDK